MCIPLAIAGGLIAAAGSLGAAGIGAASSGAAADAQKDAAGKAMDLQREMMAQQQANYTQSREDMAPWLEAGRGGLGELLRQMQSGQFEVPYERFDGGTLATDPGFQFRMAEGQKALERSASARGLLNSGGALKSLERYSQGVASDEYQNAFNRHQADYAARQTGSMNRYNRLASLAGLGQASAQSLGGLGAQFNSQLGQGANSMTGLYGAIGNANAANAMATGNAMSNGLNQFAGGLGYAMMNGGGQQIPTQGTPYYLANPQAVPNQTPSYGYGSDAYTSPGYTGPWSP